MPESQQPTGTRADPDEAPAAQPVPVPDEDGPHDVPDEKVIEKTLPAAPGSSTSGGAGPDSGGKPQALNRG
jgi:hypothetical protein